MDFLPQVRGGSPRTDGPLDRLHAHLVSGPTLVQVAGAAEVLLGLALAFVLLLRAATAWIALVANLVSVVDSGSYRTEGHSCSGGTEMTGFAEFGSTFLLLGPPAVLLAGTTLTVVTAVHLKGRKMWLALTMGPLFTFGCTLASTWFVITVLRPGEGSGFLLGLSAIFLYALLMAPYYLVLAGLGLRARLRTKRAEKSGGWT